MSCVQLELFERSEIEIAREEIKDLEKALGNVRRGMFGRHDELEKKLQNTKEEMEKLKDAFHLLQEQMRNYEAALFPIGDSEVEGLKSMSVPVSSWTMASQTSSMGLSFPK